MQDDAPEVIASTVDAPWLPPGGVADVVLGGPVLRPTGLVRLLLTDEDRVFCTRRDGSGKLDLPTARVGAEDHDGAVAIAGLARQVVGGPVPLRYVGAVRNTVTVPTPEYEWPTPVAVFAVWTTDAVPVVPGEWIAGSAGSVLAERHWYPLFRRLVASAH
ncbi:NUDIX hydrolase [Curtobacterium sp. MCLR17_032]|uniref:NUDIX hydrolase n=1 Tax=Curtobacterium sp. MCLR17_032 TaxID=2175650 RepID=UPI000DA955B7|nr:NUDIX hydrolase [Curtobacterium sp. MCLR17_032]WIE60666.1 NUDIX hydrolase [Curtobacterium sp. MCLR17_032]